MRFLTILCLWISGTVFAHACSLNVTKAMSEDPIEMASTLVQSKMSKKTVLNEPYKGLVESMSIPAEVHERDGKKFASFGSTVPIHCCTAEEVSQHARSTHHYCDIFSDQLMAPLGELAYVRLDETTAEKVFINRNKRILLVSSDGVLAQWRCAPTFESANSFLAGAPLVNQRGELVSVVTAKKGNHYAVSNFEGDGGYFNTPTPWKVVVTPEGDSVYGDRSFPSRDAIREYIASLPPIEVSASSPLTPVLHLGAVTRITLVAANGRQVSHALVQGVNSTDVEYL